MFFYPRVGNLLSQKNPLDVLIQNIFSATIQLNCLTQHAMINFQFATIYGFELIINRFFASTV
jgi:hypothetical protein